jgi:hypothetical protein
MERNPLSPHILQYQNKFHFRMNTLHVSESLESLDMRRGWLKLIELPPLLDRLAKNGPFDVHPDEVRESLSRWQSDGMPDPIKWLESLSPQGETPLSSQESRVVADDWIQRTLFPECFQDDSCDGASIVANVKAQTLPPRAASVSQEAKES